MKNNNKPIILLITSIFFVVLLQTIAYSSFSASFNIKGSAHARLATDVRITDFKISEKYTSSNYISNYEKFSKNSVSPSITFDGTGIVYYDVEITNYNQNKVGIYSIDGLPSGVSCDFHDININTILLDGIGKTTFTISFSGTGSYEFNFLFDIRTVYNITYEDFEGNGYSNIIFENEKKDINFGTEKVNKVLVYVNGLDYKDYVLSDNILTIGPVNGDVVITKKPDILKIINGNLETVGSEVDIGNERFYIVSNNGNTLTLLAKYNLYVDGKYSEITDERTLYGSAATGIQQSTMRGWLSGNSIANGVTHFSETRYWSGKVSKYPSYVYSNNSNSNVYKYVENYKTYLENKGATIEEARLIKLEELETLGCVFDDSTCSGAPSWVYYTTYWTGTAESSTYVIAVYSDREFGADSYDNDFGIGVRPVIVLKI